MIELPSISLKKLRLKRKKKIKNKIKIKEQKLIKKKIIF